ncbi:MAG: class I SAM-dependent methyltransferase [Chloroflexi bacterium]|nr:class I SAM-dependent methyltransferase [Chloroflexota bacterium]
MNARDLERAALRGEPSYVWRAGQARRLAWILDAASDRAHGRVLDDGCGLGLYLERLATAARAAVGVEFDAERARQAGGRGLRVAQAAGERLPFPDGSFDLILSHEVLEHVADDRQAMREISRLLAPGGRAVIFVPNRGYPFETHGIYWRGRYRFGNVPLVNYLPPRWRDRLAPHVRAYTRRELERLIVGLPLHLVRTAILYGAYDNIIARWPRFGAALRTVLQALEGTPLRALGLSHAWVVEKTTT